MCKGNAEWEMITQANGRLPLVYLSWEKLYISIKTGRKSTAFVRFCFSNAQYILTTNFSLHGKAIQFS